MSAYITLMTPMTNQESLLAALTDVGFQRGQIEVHAEAVPLVGYGGERRSQTANIVVRRQHVGSASNDLGFLATPTGYQLQVSDYDRHQYGNDWVRRLHDRYRHHEAIVQERLAEAERRRLEEKRRQLVEAQRLGVLARAKQLGYQVKETREGDAVRLVLIKRTY
jgi:hypothetical protein